MSLHMRHPGACSTILSQCIVLRRVPTAAPAMLHVLTSQPQQISQEMTRLDQIMNGALAY